MRVQHDALPIGLSARAHRAVDQPISYLMAEALHRPGLISLAAGFVDYDTLPAQTMRQLCEGVLGSDASAKEALQYGTTPGRPDLREALYEHMAGLDGMAPHDFPGSAEQVVVSTGSQQLLHILTDLLIDPGDIVITGWPSYFVYTGALSAFGAAVRGVDLDDHGLQPDKLEALLEQLDTAGDLPRVKVLYLCTYHQNPTGLTLPAERKQAIFDLVVRYSQRAGHRILIVDDAAYRELTYDAPQMHADRLTNSPRSTPAQQRPRTPPTLSTGDSRQNTLQASVSLKAIDIENAYVALLQTFSKPFSPGLKTGYGLLPDDLIEPAVLNKGGRDFGSANFIQCLLNRALREGVYAEQVRRVCRGYRVKRDAMVAALDRHLGAVEGVTWTRPAGGLYVWLALPKAMETGRHGKLFGAALDAGMLYVPGEYCFPMDQTREIPGHAMRLCFSVPGVELIHEGVARLGQAVRACL